VAIAQFALPWTGLRFLLVPRPAGLELAKQGHVVLEQPADFQTI
jgi:hypothetical protein